MRHSSEDQECHIILFVCWYKHDIINKVISGNEIKLLDALHTAQTTGHVQGVIHDLNLGGGKCICPAGKFFYVSAGVSRLAIMALTVFLIQVTKFSVFLHANLKN